nr:MAG TPA: hypothetical protein [Caudoviricetes sp.]
MTNQWLVSHFNIASFIGDLTWLNLLLKVSQVRGLVFSTHLMIKTISFHNKIKSTHLIFNVWISFYVYTV